MLLLSDEWGEKHLHLLHCAEITSTSERKLLTCLLLLEWKYQFSNWYFGNKSPVIIIFFWMPDGLACSPSLCIRITKCLYFFTCPFRGENEYMNSWKSEALRWNLSPAELMDNSAVDSALLHFHHCYIPELKIHLVYFDNGISRQIDCFLILLLQQTILRNRECSKNHFMTVGKGMTKVAKGIFFGLLFWVTYFIMLSLLTCQHTYRIPHIYRSVHMQYTIDNL